MKITVKTTQDNQPIINGVGNKVIYTNKTVDVVKIETTETPEIPETPENTAKTQKTNNVFVSKTSGKNSHIFNGVNGGTFNFTS